MRGGGGGGSGGGGGGGGHSLKLAHKNFPTNFIIIISILTISAFIFTIKLLIISIVIVMHPPP